MRPSGPYTHVSSSLCPQSLMPPNSTTHSPTAVQLCWNRPLGLTGAPALAAGVPGHRQDREAERDEERVEAVEGG